MITPRLCCGKPPVVLTGISADGAKVFSCACLVCGRSEESRDRERAVKKFNEYRVKDFFAELRK